MRDGTARRFFHRKGRIVKVFPTVIVAFVMPMTAFAGSCTETPAGSGNFICSGVSDQATDTKIKITGAAGQDLTIETVAGFGLDTSLNNPNRPSFLIKSPDGDITILGNSNSTIAALGYGIKTRTSDGSVDVNWAGNISADTKVGINAEAVNGDVSVIWTGDAADAAGNLTTTTRHAILARATDGDIFIDWSGDAVTFLGGVNILAREVTGGSPSDVDVTLDGSISAGLNGAKIRNLGTGTTNVLLKGSISAATNGALVQSLGGDMSVTLADGAEITQAGESGLVILHGADQSGAHVAGAAESGNLELTIDGDVTADGAKGAVRVVTAGNTVDTSVVGSGNIVGAYSGVSMLVKSLGDTTVDLSGQIVAKGGIGVDVDAGDLLTGVGGDLAVSVSDVLGSDSGVRIVNSGGGSTSLLARGAVQGESGVGISASTSGDGLSVETQSTVTGATTGVQVENSGVGATSITTHGAVIGSTGTGIYAYVASQNSDDLVVVANDAVTGGADAIFTFNQGAGATSISVTGDVSGGIGAGIANWSSLDQTVVINVAETASVKAISGDAIVDLAGNSTLNVAAGAAVEGSIQLGGGSDILNFYSDLSAITLLDGGDDAGSGDGWVDRLVLGATGDTVSINGANVANWETVGFGGGVTASVTDLVTETLNASCAGETTLTGASAVDVVNGCAANDMITISGTSLVAQDVSGAGGADVITVSGGAIISGNVYGGGDGQDASSAVDTGDTILLMGGSVTGFVDAGEGDNAITLAGTGVTGDLLSGAGADTFTLTSGSALQVSAGAGADTITLNGATVASVDAGAGDDATLWSAGLLTRFSGGDGSDLLTITASEYDGQQILDGGDDSGSGDGWLDRVVLDGVAGSLSGAALSNWEVINLANGDYSFSDDALSVGDSTSQTGLFLTSSTLDGAVMFSLTGNMHIDASSTFVATNEGNGVYDISGSLSNFGTVDMQDGFVGDAVIIGGDYTGVGTITADVDFSSDSSDQLVVTGDVTSGDMTIVVSDVSSGLATGSDIRVVDVGGSSSAEIFVLNGGDINSGAFTYGLEQIGSDWFLASSFLAQVPTYEAYPRLILGMSDLASLEQRTGSRNYLMAEKFGEKSGGVWLRFIGETLDVTPAISTTSLSYDSKFAGVQFGADLPLSQGGAGVFTGGINLTFGRGSMDVSSVDGNGRVSSDRKSIAATLTWQRHTGLYADAQLQYGSFESDVYGVSNAGTGRAMSIEFGRKFDLRNDWAVTPQMQMVHSSVAFDGFTGVDGEVVNVADGTTTRLRVGVSAEKFWTDTYGNKNSLYGVFNLHKYSDGSTTVLVSGIELDTDQSGLTGEFGIGGTYAWDQNQSSVYGELSVSHDLGGAGDLFGINASAGVRWEF